MLIVCTCCFLLLFIIIIIKCQAEGCEPDWFGRQCQYLKNCATAACDSGGRCWDDAQCQKGWFGPACQYLDLVTNVPARVNESKRIVDGPSDRSCPPVHAVTIIWEMEYHISWIRVYVQHTDVRPNVAMMVELHGQGSLVLNCRHIFSANTILDIHCNQLIVTRRVEIVRVDGGVLCAYFISGGRNIAIKQPTSQTSTQTYNEFPDSPLWSGLAVDGDTSAHTVRKCSSTTFTNLSSPAPTWTISFTPVKTIYHIIVYNRERFQYRLKGFRLTCFGLDGSILFTHTDKEAVPLAIYKITVRDVKQPVSNVQIQAAPQPSPDTNKTQWILVLCEVQIFGDSVCPPETFGLDCEHKCSCLNKSETCYTSLGFCSSGCTGDQCGSVCVQGTDPASGVVTFVAVGVSIGVVAVIFITVMISYCCCRKRKRKEQAQDYDIMDVDRQISHTYNGLLTSDTSTGAAETNMYLEPSTALAREKCCATDVGPDFACHDSTEYEQLEDYHVYTEMM